MALKTRDILIKCWCGPGCALLTGFVRAWAEQRGQVVILQYNNVSECCASPEAVPVWFGGDGWKQLISFE